MNLTENSILKKIEYAIQSFSMLEKGDKVLVGFSGGKDSVVLLHSLSALSKAYGITLTAFHVNHGIRGQEALRDRDFCEAFCKKHGIPFAEASVDAIRFSKDHRLGLEEGARIIRYCSFESYANEHNITKIATAHTSSDNLETVIFNLIKGSGTDGLKGIPPVRNNIIRPLIYCSTEDILEYAKENSLEYVTDSTNSDTEYSRNNIRHNVIPHLKAINPKAEEAVSRMCDSVRQDSEFITSFIEDSDSLSTQNSQKMHKSILTKTLMSMYKKVSENGRLSKTNVDDIVNILREYSKTNCRQIKKICLPDKIDFVITPEKCYFERHTGEKNVLIPQTLSLGITKLGKNCGKIAIFRNENEIEKHFPKNIYKNATHVVVNDKVFGDTISVRARKDGDTFSFSNMTKKVKKMFNEAKIPLDQRDILPVFCDEKGIFWIPGFPLRDDVKPTNCENTLHIYYLSEETTL
ncbi:MAG: tRNA lysidine(34) synthetase TilS [Clostridia bacterium]|nr:tRNA lysidine(34) synthetase TilS [Clostridia bacterium]